jgi:dipeptidyl aminopeptidase/acylaminoacyl peptidase
VDNSRKRALRPSDLFALRYVHEARLRPDGSRIACLTSRIDENQKREHFELAILDLRDGTQRALEFPGRVSSPCWSPDGSALAFLGATGGCVRVYVTDADAREVRAVTPQTWTAEAPISWAPDGLTLAVTGAQRSAAHSADVTNQGFTRVKTRLFRREGAGIVDNPVRAIQLIDLPTGSSRPLDVGMAVSMQPVFSPCGKRILFVGAHEPIEYSTTAFRGADLCTFDLASRAVTTVLSEPWMISGATWSPCGDRIVFAGAYASTTTVPTMDLWVIDRDGSNAQCRTEGFEGSVGLRFHHDMPTFGSESGSFVVMDAFTAYATVTRRGCGEIWKVALTQQVQCAPVLSGPRSCLIMDASPRTGQLLYTASDLNLPWELHVSSSDGKGERRLTHLNDAVLAGWPSMTWDHLEFASPDGLPLEGWFLKREDLQGPQPTVMFVHGGPYYATGHAFRFDFQLLAANGFAVLFANFRGSTGYGDPFAKAIMGDWGARGFPDHMAAVDAAVKRGLADPERLGVWGPSHGGFATCWIVGHTTRFRAAVAESAVTNFATHYYLTDATQLFTYDLGGRPDEIPDVYRSRSPLTYAWRCRTPTLMLHGEDDLRVPIAEAEQFYRALHDAGCVTELVRVPGMNHAGAVTGPLSARLAQNEALLNWFERFV